MAVNTLWILLVAFAAWLATFTPSTPQNEGSTTEPIKPPFPDLDRREARRSADHMASVLHDLEHTQSEAGSRAIESVGNLWIEVTRLRRGGQDVRPIEWYVSDLERSLRVGQHDTSARRHILNNLSYELDALKRRNAEQ